MGWPLRVSVSGVECATSEGRIYTVKDKAVGYWGA